MSNSVEERARRPAPHQSVWYDNETPYSVDGKTVVSPYNDFSSKWAGGGFLSTAEDLVRFGSAHIQALNKGYLTKETIDLMFTVRSRELPGMGYGLGWMVAVDPHFRNASFHFGAGSGSTSLLVVYPGEGFALAILANLGHARFPPERLFGIVNPFLGDPSSYVLGATFAFVLTGFAFMLKSRRQSPRLPPHTGSI